MICLSFDTDHMNEERMQEFLELVNFPGKGTFFCTQPYVCLSKTNHELAPHPYLGNEVNWETELNAKRKEFPLAVGWRSHSCVFSHALAEWLGQNHYQYVSIHDDCGKIGMVPTKNMWGVWHLPIYYMDTMDISCHKYWGSNSAPPFNKELLTNALENTGLYVFGFHPIHILLNTPDPDYYFSVRNRFKAGEPIETLKHKGYGVANFFLEFCLAMKQKGHDSLAMAEALEKYK